VTGGGNRAEPAAPFVANLVLFVRHLRERGMSVTPQTSADLATVIEMVGLADRDDLYYGFRSVVVARPSDLAVFDEAFAAFFGAGLFTASYESRGPSVRLPRSEPTGRANAAVLGNAMSRDADATGELVAEIVGGSYAERLATRDFGGLSPEEAEEVRRLLARMLWRPAETPSRRWRPARSGHRPDMRRTLRRLTSPEGDLMPIAFRDRRLRRRPLVVLADISGSMERYSEMFLHFIHGAQGRLGRVESFVFATRLTRITREMRLRTTSDALERVSDAVLDWSGGTRIGEVIGTFNRDWSRRVTRGGAIALVISDGWDRGDPELLAMEMARLARSVHRVVWLNPLAGRAGYQPETRGMQAALPYVDDFLPAATILDLREVVQLLESVPARRGGLVRR
jgi:hypothetical protein